MDDNFGISTSEEDWNRYQIFVLKELQRLSESQEKMMAKIEQLCVDIAVEKKQMHYISAGIALFISALINSVLGFMNIGGE